MKPVLTKISAMLLISSFASFLFSCEKDAHNPPKLEFKTGASYISSDRTLKKDTTITVGIIATKTEDEFKTFNVSKSYDNATSNTTVSNTTVSKSEEDGFTKDISIQMRNQTGYEKYIFTATDKDGNVTSITLNFTVQ
jgi:hypothetical protein